MNPGAARRRVLLAGLASVVAPRLASAQATGTHRVGFVSPATRGRRDVAFVQGLRELGYVDGKNLALVMRFADGARDRLPGLVDELVRAKVDVLVVGSTIGALEAKRATSTLPVVFAGSSDPIAGGLVSSLARPGGNMTGVSLGYGDGVAGKWLELLKETAPPLARAAALWSSSNAAAAAFVRELEGASRRLGVSLDARHASNPAELDAALAAIRADAQGLVVTPSPFAASSTARLVRFAAERRLPSIYFDETFVDAGGLMSYGPSISEAYRRAATHVDRILKGARPGDLPVEQPTRFELCLNLATARALGLDVPAAVRMRADRTVG